MPRGPHNLRRTARAFLALAADAAGAWVLVLAAASGMASILTWLSSLFIGGLPDVWALVLATFSAGLLVGIFGKIFRSGQGPARWLIRGYRCIHAEYIYEIDRVDTTRHSQIVRLELEAIRPGVSVFELRYRWTGQGPEDDPELLSANHRVLGSVLSSKDWRHYYVHLGKELVVGERVEVKVRQQFRDDGGQFIPFLGKVIKDPINSLALRVLVPPQLTPTDVKLRELISDAEDAPVANERPGEWDQYSGEIRWDISSPRFGHYYEITWRQARQQELAQIGASPPEEG